MSSKSKRRKVQSSKVKDAQEFTPASSFLQENLPEGQHEEGEESTPYEALLASIPKATVKKYIYQKNKQKRNKDGSQSVLPSEQPKPATGECMKDSSSEDEEIEDENSDWEADQDVSDSDNDTKCDSRKDPFKLHLDHLLAEEDVAILNERPTLCETWKVEDFGLVASQQYLKLDRHDINLEDMKLMNLHVKTRLCNRWSSMNRNFTKCQKRLFKSFHQYQDVLYTQRSFDNGEEIRRLYALHALNHVLKSRLKVLKNNAKIRSAKMEGKEIGELQDQGFTRPKVLILVPFREAALRTVNVLISLLLAEGEGQVAYRRRFTQEFKEQEEFLEPKVPKPASFKSMFEGNIDDCFRIGVSVRGKQVKLYSDFYSSDIIVASPLGLRTVIGADDEKKGDFDFLSSIEMVVVDQADVYLMQNWEHVLHVFTHLHRQPKESHDMDISRLRLWAANGWSKYYCQTVVFSAFPTPEIVSLFTKYAHSYEGKVTVHQSDHTGSICQVALVIPQVFQRISCDRLLQQFDQRFQYFIDKILPDFKTPLMQRTAIFIPSYFDFVRIRNYMKKEDISFCQICEYTNTPDVKRARAWFAQGKRHFLIFTERFHFFHRFRLKGIRHLVFYQLPTYPEFYSEIVNFIDEGHNPELSSPTCHVLYTKFDQQSLSRVVGSARSRHMVEAGERVHMLVSGK
jgi:U3 small nucleolar RNA-associated protein 25